MNDDHFVASKPNLDEFMALQRRMDAAEALARERMVAIETLEWERDRLRMELEEKVAETTPGPESINTAPPKAEPANAEAPAAGPPPGGHGVAQRLALAVYRVFRPVLRPVAWRVREFLVGELRREIAEISQRQELLLGRSRSGTGTMDAAFVSSMERLLLTLALEQRPDCTQAKPGAGLSKADSDS